MHISDREKCNWIRTKMEHLVHVDKTKEKKMHILERLAFSVVFERFLGNKYNTTKRFGLDGGESLIPGLKYMIDRATELVQSTLKSYYLMNSTRVWNML